MRNWLRERTMVEEKNINMIIKTAGKCPQDSYAVVVWAIQSEWIFLQRIIWDTGDAVAGVENMLWEKKLSRLLFRNTKTLSPIVGSLSTMPVKKSGLGLLNPVTPAKEKCLSSQMGSAELIRGVRGVRSILQHQPPPGAWGRKA